MSKGQRAMAVALIYPDTEQGKKSDDETSSVTEEVAPSRLSYARTIIKYAPDLAANVLAGSASLDEAYKTAREVKRGAWVRRGWRST